MRLLSLTSCLTAIGAASAATNVSKPLSSKQILPHDFRPAQVFENVNLVRNVNLEKGYPRENINVVVKNVGKDRENQYYIPFEADLMSRIGGFEVRDKKDVGAGAFRTEISGFETEASNPTEFYVVHLPKDLEPKSEITLAISYTVLSALDPLPDTIEQLAQQTVNYKGSAYAPSAYKTLKQKTKLKLPTTNVPDYTVIPNKNAEGKEDPQKQGSSFTYGPYENTPAGAVQEIALRYEFTKPLIHATLLERDIEVSHWGGNLATEDRYWLGNRAAKLKNHFNRVQWQMTQYSRPPTTAMRELSVPLQVGSMNPYYIDDIGNVSTSRFQSSPRHALLELKPRYPIFGGWKYKFRVGWDADLKNFLRKVSGGDGYVLKVPFLEGPKMGEGVEYERVEVQVILPEGATNVRFSTSVPIVSDSIELHKTFMDTLGRPTLKLTAINIVDEWRDKDLIVTYDYSWTAGYRKPLTIAAGLGSIFLTAWIVGNLDIRIGKGKKA